ncbi:MAG: prenyltransferase/squalene oxidase repeat-containing protein, partial [Planctomycetota bacterium]
MAHFVELLLILLFLASGYEEIPLYLEGPSLKGKEPVMVRGFVAFPRGALDDVGEYTVLDKKRKPCPADLIPTSRWEDHSIRTLALKAVVPANLSDEILRLVRKGSEKISENALQIQRGREGRDWETDTGTLRLVVDRESPSLIHTLNCGDEIALEPKRGMDLEIRLEGTAFRAAPPREILILPGKAEAEILIRGCTSSRFSGPGPPYELSLCLHAGSSWIHCRLKIPGQVLAGSSQGITMRIKPFIEKRKPRIRLVGQSAAGKGKVFGGGETGVLCARNSRVFGGNGNRQSRLPMEGWAALSLEGIEPAICLGLPRFKQLHPWSVQYQGGARLDLCLLSNAFQWEEGFYLERNFLLGFGSKAADPLLSSRLQSPVRCMAFGLTKSLEQRIFPFAGKGKGRKDALYGLYIKVTDDLISRLLREWNRWDGFMNYGDYRTHFGHFGNNEFDPAYGLLKRFLLAGRFRDLAVAETMLLHSVRYDRTGPDELDQWQGVPYVHGEDHRSGWIELGHMWVDGLLLLHRLTAERDFQTAALDIGRCMAGQPFDEDGELLERSASWSLMALTALTEAGHSHLEDAMNRAAALIRSCQTRSGYFRFNTSEGGDESCYGANVWVTAGITMEALYRHYVVTGDVRSRAALLSGARWLTRSCLHKSGGWCRRLNYSRKNENELLEKKGRCAAEEIVFIALGLARAGQLSGSGRMIQRARKNLEEGLR